MDFLRSPVAECRVKTLAIVADLDVPRNVIACFLPRRVSSAVNPLYLDRRIERFRERIVEAYPGPPHGLADSQPFQHPAELSRRIITPAVTVEYRAGRETDVAGGHLDGGGDQRRLVIVGHRPADDPAGRAVDDRR